MKNLPPWIEVHENPISQPEPIAKLQAGEQATILLADGLKAQIVLMDEKAGRRVAANRGLRVTGFRYSPTLLKAALERFGPK